MKKSATQIILGLYNLLLAGFAIWGGILMISAVQVFSEYPPEWQGVLPFDSWLPYGLIALVVFGLGNLAAAVFCFAASSRLAAICSEILGALLCLIMLGVFLITGQTYLPGSMILIAGALQLVLSILLLARTTKEKIKHENS